MNSEKEAVFTMRLPQTLNNKLVREAKTEQRSRHSQIVYLLSKHFETPGANNKKEVRK